MEEGEVMSATGPSYFANRLGLRRAFYRSPRVQAGWHALVFFIVLLVLVESLVGYVLKAVHNLFGPGETPGGVLVEKTVLFGCTLLVSLIAGVLERRSIAEYGLPWRKAFCKEFWAGSLWGLGIVSANIALMVVFQGYSFGRIALPALGILKYACLWAAAYLAVGIAEEFAFRGYLQYTLTRSMRFWPAAVVTSILFGLIHLDVNAPWQAMANIAVLSLFACMALRRTGNLWFAIGCHLGFDWADGFFYSSSGAKVQGHLFDASLHGSKWISGANAGPTGNFFNVFLAAVGILLLSRIYPEVKYPRAVADADTSG
jgi:uncharacterized protein